MFGFLSFLLILFLLIIFIGIFYSRQYYACIDLVAATNAAIIKAIHTPTTQNFNRQQDANDSYAETDSASNTHHKSKGNQKEDIR